MTSPNRTASRVAASLLGSYAFVWGFISLGAVFGLLAGLGYDEALQLSSWFGLLVFIASLCGAFAIASLLRVWTVFLTGGALMTCAAWVLLRALH